MNAVASDAEELAKVSEILEKAFKKYSLFCEQLVEPFWQMPIGDERRLVDKT